MTILYKPVLIESAEQAEALPIGTVVLPPARHRGPTVVTVKGRDELWRETGSEQPFTDAEMLDEIALVPIEAEEHEDEEYGILSDRYSPPDVIPAVGWQTLTPADRQYRRTVYTTPWEEA